MDYRALLGEAEEHRVFPWCGEAELVTASGRRYRIAGERPDEHGWYTFRLAGRRADFETRVDADPTALARQRSGYLAGDRFLEDHGALEGRRSASSAQDPELARRVAASEPVRLLEPTDRFARVHVGEDARGRTVFLGETFPLGPEEEVRRAFEDGAESLAAVRGVPPGLEAAFRVASWQRAEAQRQRERLEAEARAQAAREAQEEQAREAIRTTRDAVGRRRLAAHHFEAAAALALGLAGAQLLDWREGRNRRERVVRYRLGGERFECVVDEALRVIDAGICLVAHGDDPRFAAGTRADTWLTLESLPAVVREAEATGRLVVFRHVE